jgi:predicted nucleotidyltransferase
MGKVDNAALSGRFVLRIDPGLHAALRASAEAMGVSLNEYCTRKLAAPVGNLAPWTLGSDAVQYASSLLGESLVGVVAFGSWARADMHEDSDIDLLIVVDDDVKLERDLYHRWDESPILWQGHRVEPHFVHLPNLDRTTTGLWAEVAVDGIVLYIRDHRLSETLARVRRDIADGRIVRRMVHGQPYWIEVARP